MKPDIRPVKVLTRAILDTSSHWCFIGLSSISGEVLQADRLWVLNGVVTKGAPMRGAVNAMPESATCYPCKHYAPFEPIPWALLPGEEEIDAWTALTTRLGFRATPRRQINLDGTETPVWVWEADQ